MSGVEGDVDSRLVPLKRKINRLGDLSESDFWGSHETLRHKLLLPVFGIWALLSVLWLLIWVLYHRYSFEDLNHVVNLIEEEQDIELHGLTQDFVNGLERIGREHDV